MLTITNNNDTHDNNEHNGTHGPDHEQHHSHPRHLHGPKLPKPQTRRTSHIPNPKPRHH